MSRTASEIIEEARALSPEDRARVAEELLRTLDAPEQASIDAAWAALADERARRHQAGRTAAVDVGLAVDEIRRRSGERRCLNDE